MVSADGSDPHEVRQWQQQQAAEAELAAAEDAVKAGGKVLCCDPAMPLHKSNSARIQHCHSCAAD